MTYSRFNQLALAIGTAVILGSVALSLTAGGSPEPIEIIAQFMILGVIYAAVYYGRRGGLIAAAVASAAYALMRFETLTSTPLTLTMATVFIARFTAFGVVGIVGGEACNWIRYSLARLEGGTALDEWSRVYNQAYASKAIDQALGRFRRYGESFSVAIITLSPSLLADFKPARQRSIIRTLAHALRADVRMVDEIARLDDGRFLVLLPHTPKEGGLVVSQRLGTLTRNSLGASDQAVNVVLLAAAEDEAALGSLAESIAPPAAGEAS